MKILNFADFRHRSFRSRLAQFYGLLERVTLSPHCSSEMRRAFFLTAQGEFIAVCRLKKKLTQGDVAEFLKMSIHQIEDIECGRQKMEDVDFFNLCNHMGATMEVRVFLEKLHRVLHPVCLKLR